ncbi:hypothetical protein L1049_023747 [Liquidambar formosana]|uniref:TCP domain-containing protein n=1 Tax=Liquidambar formosana TaxID=63359 RepID=A0AAP0WZ01_LIQFO
MGMKSTGGEIVQVQGGHIVRSTGRKDRHSKVYTAKGPRDRRVRLSAHTAIQFYDVQDRLGYDRPSKAVDWLIKKAKSSIDKLAELPPWHPTANTGSTAVAMDADLNAGSDEIALTTQQQESSGYKIQVQRQFSNNESSFIPPPLDSDNIADTMKSFFPKPPGNSSINFQNYPHGIISSTAYNTQDLCLSLQSFHDPDGESSHNHSTEQTLFTGSAPVAFDANSGSWNDHQPPDMSRFQRMVAWSSGMDTENRGGFIFNSPALAQQQMLSQGSEFSQRGPLQSSFAPFVRAWDDLPIAPDNHHKSSMSGGRFSSDAFPGFCIPARIHGEEDRGVVSDKPHSASSNSHH